MVANVCSANRAISLAQDRAAEYSTDCQCLEKVVSSLISDGEGRKVELERVRGERERQGKMQAEYRRKMAQYRERASLVEERGPVQRELAELERKIKELREKSIAMLHLTPAPRPLPLPSPPGVSYMHGEGLKILSGDEQRCLHNQISETEAAAAMMDREMVQVEQQVSRHAILYA